jgi:hypothetical protein
MDNKRIKDNHIVVHGWMRTELDLKGNELLLYALIYGFSQDGRSEFSGSIAYMIEWTGIAKKNIIANINSLLKKYLITKREEGPNGNKKCFYKAIQQKENHNENTPVTKGNISGYETTPERLRNDSGAVTKSNLSGYETTHNNIIYNIKDNIVDNIPPIVPQTDFEIIDCVVEKDYEFADVEVVDELDFENVWKMYGEHGNKYLAQCEWKLIPLEDKRKVIQHIPEYNKSISDIRYKKKFENYLKAKEYNVKPINRNNNGQRTTKQSSLTDEDIFDIVSRAYSDDL